MLCLPRSHRGGPRGAHAATGWRQCGGEPQQRPAGGSGRIAAVRWDGRALHFLGAAGLPTAPRRGFFPTVQYCTTNYYYHYIYISFELVSLMTLLCMEAMRKRNHEHSVTMTHCAHQDAGRQHVVPRGKHVSSGRVCRDKARH